MLLRTIIEEKKRKYRKKDNIFQAKLEALKHWILSCPDVNMDELKYAISLLQIINLEAQVINFVFLTLATKIKESINWDDVLKITSLRPSDVKKAIWSRLSNDEKERLNQMKYQYENELKEWLTSENLSIVALDLEACEDIEMISLLWRIYNRQAIRLASKQVASHKADQISEWIQQLDTVT